MVKHDTVRAFCTQKESSTTLRERLIAIGGFSLIGMSFFFGWWWV